MRGENKEQMGKNKNKAVKSKVKQYVAGGINYFCKGMMITSLVKW